ncbi:MAG: citrate synthase, partial [Bacillota bacterium]|nr:citrate synthase [Bacillota bacterium]
MKESSFREFSTKQAREMYCSLMSDKIARCSQIDSSLYEVHDVKRGLRNNNGTGVCVGLTKIGMVDGYDVVDGKKTAVEGRLFYRGINVQDIVDGCLKDKRFG